MYVFNVTTQVSHSVSEEWMQWLKEIQLPEIMLSKCFSDFQIYKLLGHDETQGLTFVIQFFVESKESYENFIQNYAEVFRQNSITKWGNEMPSFETLLQKVA